MPNLKCPHCGKAIPSEVIAAHLGKLSAKKLASKLASKRDKKALSEHFRKLQENRKTFGGGRPPSKKTTKKS